MKIRAAIPNCLSYLRAVTSPSLPFLVSRGDPRAVAVLALGVVSDVSDGYLARRWGVDSQRGARIDTLADVSFYLSAALTVFNALPRRERNLYGWAVVPLAVMRLDSIIFHRLADEEDRHTLVNRLTGAALVIGAATASFGSTEVSGRIRRSALGVGLALGYAAMVVETVSRR